MPSNKKVIVIFEVLRQLRHGAYTKQELADRFRVDLRTIDRYFKDLEDIGFWIDCRTDDKRYYIFGHNDEKEKHYFTPEETGYIRQLLGAGTAAGNPLHDSLLKKIFTLSQAEVVSRHMMQPERAEWVMHINRAIRDRRAVLLLNYRSGNSGVADRHVEPVEFGCDYKLLWAFDIEKKGMRSFRIERMDGVQVRDDISWQNQQLHQVAIADPFGMNEGECYEVHLKMSTRARNLMGEEHPETRQDIYEENEGYGYRGTVYGLKGIGRFVLGLINEVEIIEPRELKDYLREKIGKARF